jgi:hypothetical protein
VEGAPGRADGVLGTGSRTSWNAVHPQFGEPDYAEVRRKSQPVEKPLTRSLRPQIGYQTRQFWRVSGSLCGRYQLGADFFNRLRSSRKLDFRCIGFSETGFPAPEILGNFP